MRDYPHLHLIQKSPLYFKVDEYLSILLEIGRSPETRKRYESALRDFMLWSLTEKVRSFDDVSRETLKGYRRHLYHYRKTDGQPLMKGSLNAKLTPVKKFFIWCYDERLISVNIAKDFEVPSKPRGLPAHILSHEAVLKILAEPNLKKPAEFRDRVMMEVMYCTGIRRAEIACLKTFEIDFIRSTVKINKSKNGQDRFVPISPQTLDWVTRYLKEVRPSLVCDEDDGTLFLSHKGIQFEPGTIAARCKRYIKRAGIDTRGACHLFRHSVATQMLENGANIRYIQALLGHKELNTTEIYTRVSMKKLQEVHQRTHPSNYM